MPEVTVTANLHSLLLLLIQFVWIVLLDCFSRILLFSFSIFTRIYWTLLANLVDSLNLIFFNGKLMGIDSMTNWLFTIRLALFIYHVHFLLFFFYWAHIDSNPNTFMPFLRWWYSKFVQKMTWKWSKNGFWTWFSAISREYDLLCFCVANNTSSLFIIFLFSSYLSIWYLILQ